MFTHPDNLIALSAYEIRQSHPDISFPPTITIEHVEDLGYRPLVYDEQPEIGPGETLEPGDIREEDGTYVQGWRVVALPSPSEEEKREGVLEERARRIAMGFEYDFGDERGVHYIQTRPADEEGWKQVDRWAAAMTGLDDTTSTLLILTGTGPVHVTAPEWHAIVAHGSTVQQPIWQASFALRAMDPVPENYADDEWWTEL